VVFSCVWQTGFSRWYCRCYAYNTTHC